MIAQNAESEQDGEASGEAEPADAAYDALPPPENKRLIQHIVKEMIVKQRVVKNMGGV